MNRKKITPASPCRAPSILCSVPDSSAARNGAPLPRGTIVSCAVSVDGYLDDATPSRLILSGQEDLDGVDAPRAGANPILVRAGTTRGGGELAPAAVIQDLHSERRVLTLLAEGGARILRDLLAANLADEL